MTKGKFIVFEGGDGAGKDTQIDMLRAVVPHDQYLFVKDPGSTDVGLRLRDAVLKSSHMQFGAELLTFLAARAQLVAEKIRPGLESGMTIIANRFDLSTYAYQIHGREHHDALLFVRDAMQFVLQGVTPDVVILLDVPPEVGLRRAAQVHETDRFEEERLAFHERVREGYLEHVKEYQHHHIIDATLPREEVHVTIRKILDV